MTDWTYRNEDYMRLVHAVQSGVKASMDIQPPTNDTSPASPKHLRVGVNCSLITASALAKTLIDAGVITFEQFRDNEIQLLQDEVKRYEDELSVYYGSDVKLS